MDKIVFICTGNTCRSPMAEGLFKSLNGEQKTGLEAISAGIFTNNGMPASENAVIVAKELGADISNHKSQMLNGDIVNDAKYLVCMTGAHYDQILLKFPNVSDKLFTLLPTDIDDPFGGNIDEYRSCATQIKSAVESIIERLSKK